jgi:hypothetical protein
MNHLFGVLTSPTQTYERLREKGGWVLALILLTVLSAAFAYFQWPLVQNLVEEQLANSQQPIPEEAKAMSMTIGKITAFVGAALGPALNMFFVGLLLMLVNLIVRGEATYMQLAKASLFSTVPAYVGGMISTIMIALLKPESIYDIALNAGAFFEVKKGFLFGFTSTVLDPFGLWSLALLIIGSSVMMRRSKASVAVWIILGWLIFKLIGAFSA